ncbi:MAG: hypothetical protein GY832_34550, partial [Chloroflexi bacterium]|nr:hypothetical protein [Chloroflexota bacterium]
MTVQSAIRVSLVTVLVWQIWFLHVQGWAGWKQEGKRKQEKKQQGAKKKKKAKKPFEGLTRKPVCEQCVAEAEKQEQEVKREPPPKIERKRGPPLVLWPQGQREAEDRHEEAILSGERMWILWMAGQREHNIKRASKWGAVAADEMCGKYFQETIGTIFYGSRVPAEDIMRAIALLSEGVNPRKIARVFKVDKDTVLRWLVAAAKHSEAVMGYMVHNLELTQVQMDE